jgi:hypothetical protein
LGFTCADVAKVDASTAEKEKVQRVARDIRVMLYPHENIVDSRLYTSATPPRTHGCIESLREIGSSSLDDRNDKNPQLKSSCFLEPIVPVSQRQIARSVSSEVNGTEKRATGLRQTG